MDVSKYEITPITPGAVGLQVLRALGTNPDTDGSSDYVSLLISRSVVGNDYRLTAENMRVTEEKNIGSVTGRFRGRLTKADSFLSNIPDLYNKSIETSVLAGVCVGIGASDDAIGSEFRDYDAEPVVLTSSSTFGTASFGTSTFGG